MSNQEQHKNGDGREPDKKPEIGRDDVEDLIDFGDSDDDEEIEEASEELSGSSEMQTVDGAAQDSSDEMEEVAGDLPEVVYDFDPEVQGGEVLDSGEQVVVEQQVLDLTEVLVEMVEHEERSENQLAAEGTDQRELVYGKTEEEAPPQRLMVVHGQEGNPSNQGQEEPTEIREPSNQSSENERLETFASGNRVMNRDGNSELSGSGNGSNDLGLSGEQSEQRSNDQNRNGGSSISVEESNQNSNELSIEGLNQGLKGPSEPGQGLSNQIRNGGSSRQGSSNDRNGGESSRLVQGLDKNLIEIPSASGPGLKEGPSESGQVPVAQVQNGGSSRTRHESNDQDQNGRPSRSRQGPVIDLNVRQSGSVQVLKEEPSESNRGLFDRNEVLASDRGIVEQDFEEGLNQGAVLQRINEQQSKSPYEYNREPSDRVSNKESLNGGPSRSDEDPVEQQIREENVDVCEEIMEQLELDEEEVEVNVQAHPIPDIGIERQPIPERNISLRDEIAEAADPMEQQEMALDLNGGPGSGPDPGEQREKVGQVAANEEAVAPPEVAIERPEGHMEAVPGQNEDVLPDEQDNLVEEVQILPAPLEGAIGGQDHVVAEERDADAQSNQKTE